MPETSNQRSVTFAHPFSLNGIDGTFPPGTYAIEGSREPGGSSVFHRLSRVKLLKSSQLILQKRWQETWSAAMPESKFRVGEMVDFYPSRRGLPASARSYKILRSMPSDDGNRFYRIKTSGEAFERVARESELVRVK